jgi:hypothetical protein
VACRSALFLQAGAHAHAGESGVGHTVGITETRGQLQRPGLIQFAAGEDQRGIERATVRALLIAIELG